MKVKVREIVWCEREREKEGRRDGDYIADGSFNATKKKPETPMQVKYIAVEVVKWWCWWWWQYVSPMARGRRQLSLTHCLSLHAR